MRDLPKLLHVIIPISGDLPGGCEMELACRISAA